MAHSPILDVLTMIAENGIVSEKAEDIDATATGQTAIVPARSGKRFIPVGTPLVRLKSISGTGTPPTISIGNDGSFVNVVAAVALTGLTVVNRLFNLSLLASLTKEAVDVGSVGIDVNVSVASTYDDYTIDVYVFGFYI